MAPRNSSGYDLTRRAKADLKEIARYTSHRWSPEQALRYYDSLISACEDLASGKRIGRDARMQQGLMRLSVGSHFIFFRVTGDVVEVARILHQAMDAERHF